MKKISTLALFVTIQILLQGQSLAQGVPGSVNTNTASVEPAVVARAANSRVWATLTSSTNQAGTVITQTNASYTEVAANLCVQDAAGNWLDSDGTLAIVADGASSGNSPLAVHFTGDANAAGATVNLTAPDGKVFVSQVYGISYYDPSVPTNVLIASLQSSQGSLVGNNRIVYQNAFTGLNADIWYWYRPSGLDQDIVLHDCPPSPAVYGLNPQTTLLQVYTEWFNPPQPLKTTAQDDGIVHDAYLDFGNMVMGPGAALFTQGQADPVPVDSGTIYKQWGQINGRDWLIEEIQYLVIANLLQTLPLHASAGKAGQSLFEHIASSPPLRPKTGIAGEGRPVQVAKSTPRQPGLILDYSLVSSVTNFTFQSDTTYYLSTNVIMSGTNTVFESGTVIKAASGAGLTVNSPVTWLGNPYMPLYLCAKDDNGPGDIISGSTGNPGTAYYANPALYFNASTAGTNLVLHDARISNAKIAVAINANSNHVVSDVQMVNCGNGLAATNTTYSLWNGLMYNVMTNFTGSNSTGDVEQLTADTANWLNNGQTLNLTNCLLVAVTNTGSFTSNSVYTAGSGSGVFQTVGGGAHYLPANSPYLGAGTTNIAPSLAATLAQLTTYAPVVLSNNFSVNTTLSPEVGRDTGIPAIGYHYYPLDYVCHDLTVNSGVTLTLTNGVALGFLDVTGITVKGSLVSQGTPIALNHLMSVMAAQETFLTEELYFLLIGGNGSWQNLYFRFTDLPNPGGGQAAQLWELDSSSGGSTAGPITLRDSQMRAGRLFVDLGNTGTMSSQTVNLTNNWFERPNIWFWRLNTTPPNMVVNLQNNLFHWGYMTVTFDMGSGENAPPTSPCPETWTVYDNLFQVATNEFSEVGTDSLGGHVWPTVISNAYNAYLTQTNFIASLGGDKTNFSAADFQAGALGNYYYPTNGTNLSRLIHAGSTSATNLGLYHYTVTTNNVVEGTNTVSIGFHYIAVGTNGLPLDSNGDGVADYLKDANGNGGVNSGEVNWQVFGDLGLQVWITRPQNNSVIP
jgi:hypothetical protein